MRCSETAFGLPYTPSQPKAESHKNTRKNAKHLKYNFHTSYTQAPQDEDSECMNDTKIANQRGAQNAVIPILLEAKSITGGPDIPEAPTKTRSGCPRSRPRAIRVATVGPAAGIIG